MKSQKFSEQQLTELVEGKEVVTCDVVKEGEFASNDTYLSAKHGLCALNGNPVIGIKSILTSHDAVGISVDDVLDFGYPNPMVVRLEKIEKKKIQQAFEETGIGYEWTKKNIKLIPKKAILKGTEKDEVPTWTTKKWNPDVWLKTWKMVK